MTESPGPAWVVWAVSFQWGTAMLPYAQRRHPRVAPTGRHRREGPVLRPPHGVRPPDRRDMAASSTAPCPGRRLAGDRHHGLKADTLVADIPVANQVDAAMVLSYRVGVSG